MFHNRYQSLTQLGLREKWRVHSALWSLEPGLPDKVAAVEAYMVAQLVGAAAPPIPGTSREIEFGGKSWGPIWESDPTVLAKIYLQQAVRALGAALEREYAVVYAIKLSEYHMYL